MSPQIISQTQPTVTPTPDTSKFFPLLWRGGRYANLWLRNRDSAGKRFSSQWFDLVDGDEPHFPDIAGVDVYFGVHPLTSIPTTNHLGAARDPADVRSQIPYIAAVNCLFAEFDADDFGGNSTVHVLSLDPLPSAVIRSSPGSYHAYWIFDEPFMLDSEARRESMRRLQSAWVAHVGGDPAARDLARVLRVPGTLNYKHMPPPTVEFMVANLGRLYSVKTLSSIPTPIGSETTQHTLPLAGNGDILPWQEAAIRGECAKLEAAPRQMGHHTANSAGFKLGQIVDGFAAMRNVENRLFAAYKRRGLFDNGEAEVRRTIRAGVIAGNRAENRRRPAKVGAK